MRIISIPTGQVNSLPSLRTARENSGLIVYNQVAYVFGGSNEALSWPESSLKSSESFQFPLKGWKSIGDMSENREFFNPCLWRREIYLCDGGTMDIFNPENSSFRALSVHLSQKGSVSVYIRSDSLVVLSSNLMLTVCYSGEEVVVERREHRPYSCFSQCGPVLWGNRVFLYAKGLVVVESATGEQVEALY